MLKTTFAAVLALTVCCPTFAGEPRIERIAPENSVFVLSIKSFATTVERAKSTKLWELWQSPEMSDVRAEFTKSYEEAMKEMFQELGLEDEEMPWPSGAVGMAAFPVIDEDLGVPEPAFVLYADFGDKADKANEILDAALKKGQDKGEITVDDEEVLGRKVLTIKPTEQPKNDDEAQDEDADLNDDMFDMAGPDDFFGDTEQMHFVRDGSVMMLSTDLGTLTRALEVSDGAVVRSVGDSPSFQRVAADLGESDVSAVVLFDQLGAMLGPDGEMLAMYGPMIQSAIGDVDALGMGTRLDSPTAMLDMTYRVFMPQGTAGLTALLDKQTPRAPVPNFVPSDAITYSAVNVEFKKLPGIVRTFVNDNAAMFGMNPDEALMSIEPTLQQVSAALGSEVHAFSTVTTPIQFDSLKTGYAIRCDKPAEMVALLGMYAPLAQLQPREFLGNTLYSMDPAMMGGMMEPFSVGMGGEYVFVGSTSLVEQSLRSLQGGAAANLAENPMFQHAVAALPNQPSVTWGYQNVVPMIEALQEIGKLAEKQMIEDARQFDPEYAKELEADLAKQPPSPFEKLDARTLQRYLGPTSWYVTNDGKGFLGKAFMLEPAPGK